MPNTPLGFRFPPVTNSPNVAADIQNLALDIDAFFQTGLDFAAFTPSLTATGSAPTLGGGGSVSGAMAKIGNLVILMFGIQFGTAPGAGSGAYLLNTPTSMAVAATGIASLKRASGVTSYVPSPPPSDASHVQFNRGDGTTAAWGAASPSAPANGDLFQGFFVYQSV